MPAKIIEDGSALTVLLSGEIDHHSSKQIRDMTDGKISLSSPQTLILDFRDVSFMDSSGIGLIMGRYRLMSTHGGKVYIANANAYLRRVMRLAGIDTIVSINGAKSPKEDSE